MTKNRTLAVIVSLTLIQACKQNSDPAAAAGIGAAKFAYVSDYDDGLMKCDIDNMTGLISNCVDAYNGSTPTNNQAQKVTFNSAGTVAYVNNYQDPNIIQCDVSAVDGLFSNCVPIAITSPGASPFSSEYGLLALLSDSLALVPDPDNGLVLACPISAGVLSGTCTDTGATNVDDSAVQLTLNKDKTVAYLPNYTNTDLGINVCDVASDGTMSNCNIVPGDGITTFPEPGGVALSSDESKIYIADYSPGNVFMCDLSNGGKTFSNCTSVLSFANIWTIKINGSFAYVGLWDTTVNVCPINADGTFGTCDTSANTFGEAVNIEMLY
jgi:hypothetical protein